MGTQVSLLAKAKKALPKYKIEKEVTNEHVKLAVAWANEEINLTQVGKALDISASNAYPILALSLKKHVQNLKNRQ